MHSRKLAFALVGLLIAGVALVATPSAQAQQQTALTISLAPPTESVKPLQGTLSFSGTYLFTGSQEGQSNIVGIPVQLQVTSAPAWATVVVSPSSDVIASPGTNSGAGASYAVTRPFTVSVTASDTAPAFQPGNIEITITATPPAPGKTASGKATVPVQASYFSILDTQLAKAIEVERPQQTVSFPLKITNLGNANTKINFAIEDKAANLNVPVPIPVVLQSKQAGGNQISADIPLQVQTPYKNGYMNEVGVVTYHITSSYALDPKLQGDSTRVSVLLTTKGFYVPGAELPILLGMLGVAALVLRRR